MNNFCGYTALEIEQKVIEPLGGIGRFILVKCPGYKIPRYTTDDGTQLDLAIEDNTLNEATIAYLEYRCVKEVDWKGQ